MFCLFYNISKCWRWFCATSATYCLQGEAWLALHTIVLCHFQNHNKNDLLPQLNKNTNNSKTDKGPEQRDTSATGVHKWPRITHKNTQHQWLLGEHTSKPWDNTSHSLLWLLLKVQIYAYGIDKLEPCALAAGSAKWDNHSGKNAVVLQHVKHGITSMPLDSKNEKQGLQKKSFTLHPHILSSIIHPILILITTSMATHRGMNKLGEYYSVLKNQWHSGACYNTDKPERHSTKWTKPESKTTDAIWFHLHKVPRVDDSIETESRMVGEQSHCWICLEFLLEMMEKFWKWWAMMAAQHCEWA